MLIMLSSKPKLPWCYFGDFNELLQVEDKMGGALRALTSCRLLRMSLITVVLWT